MNDISDLIESLLETNRSAEIAELEFKKLLAQDENLKEEYILWCENMGYNVRKGFHHHVEELIEIKADIWDHLTNYEDME